MALAYLGVTRSQKGLARALRLRQGFGAPAPNITALGSRRIDVSYHVDETWESILGWLRQNVPVIAFVQTRELPHWKGIRAQHAVLVVGSDEETVQLHDPALTDGPINVPAGDFMLAWDEMGNRCALITKRAQ